MCSRPMQVRKGQSSIFPPLPGAPMPPRARSTLGEVWGGCPQATPSTGGPWAPELDLLPPAQTCLWAQLEETFQAPLPCCPPAWPRGLLFPGSRRGAPPGHVPRLQGPDPTDQTSSGKGMGPGQQLMVRWGPWRGERALVSRSSLHRGAVLSPHCGLWTPGREISLSQPVGREGVRPRGCVCS